MTQALQVVESELPVEIPAGALQRTSLALPPDLSLEQTAAVYRAILGIDDASSWWKGDIQLYGWEHHGESFSQCLDGDDEARLAKYRRVCSRFPPSQRFPLSFSHHLALVRFESEADRRHWLELALANGWSVAQLRAEVRQEDLRQQGLLGPIPPKPRTLVIDRQDILLRSSCRVGLEWRPEDHDRLRAQLGLD